MRAKWSRAGTKRRAGRHDQGATQTVVDLRARAVDVERRVAVPEGKVVRRFAAVGAHRLEGGIVAWSLGVAAAAGIALPGR
jgi:hypothetical protein